MNLRDTPMPSTAGSAPCRCRYRFGPNVVVAMAAMLFVSNDISAAVAASVCYPKPIKTKWSDRDARICPVWTKPLPIPVFESTIQGARKVGVLVHGGSANWFICQVRSNVYRYANYTNVWWAWTLADNLKTWGWVQEVYFTGGSNQETRPAKNLPVCPSPPECNRAGGSGSQSFGEAPSGTRQTFGDAPSAIQTFGGAPGPTQTLGTAASIPCLQ